MKTCRVAIIPMILTLCVFTTTLHSQEPQSNLWFPNSPVYTTVTSGPTIYIGGAFTYVGPPTGSGGALITTTGSPDLDYPVVNGVIYAVAPDGSGGWYIGGAFTEVGGVTRNRLAHIMPDKTLDPDWDPNCNSTVYALAVSDTTVYVGGLFSTIGGQTRNRIAALNTSGAATSWDPDCNSIVYTLAVSDTTVYVGGLFSTIGGQTRNRIAALNTSGAATSWDPDCNSTVYALAVSDTTVYVGGQFSTIGGQTRNRIAALNTSGAATGWDPNSNSHVYALTISDTTVYAGGAFSNIGGQTRNRIAALNTSGSATSWDPNADSYVRAIAVSAKTVYVGGEFENIGGQAINSIAAIDSNGALATQSPEGANGDIYALAVSDTILYAGGNFSSIGGKIRNRIAALDSSSGTVTDWNPNANSNVLTLTLAGSKLYVGGSFTNIGGQTRSRIAALDTSTGLATSWNPAANNTVRSIAVSDTTVYVGGQFTVIGGQSRNRIAEVDTTTGTATSWDPNSNNTVFNISISGSTVYAGGYFTNIGGQARNRLAAIDSNGVATSWDPDADGGVLTLAVSGSTVYAGGLFNMVGGESRIRIAAIDASSGAVTAWDAYANSTVRYIHTSGEIVYAGGDFSNIGGQARMYIAALDANTAEATGFNPSLSGFVQAITSSDSMVYLGGQYSVTPYNQPKYFAGFFDPHLTSPDFSILPASVSFEDVRVGTTNQDSATVTNTGTSILTIDSVRSDNTEFDVSPESGLISGLGNEKFYITVTPTSTGIRNGNIIFYHDGNTSPDTLPVNGTGVEPVFTVDSSNVSFLNVVVGENKTDSITIKNTGTFTLTIDSAKSDHAEFSVTPGTGSISPSDSQKFYFTFSPTSIGGKNGHIVFYHDADPSPDTITVNGTGTTPLFSVNPATLPLLDVLVSLNKSDSVTVTNTGTATLSIDSVKSDNGEFTVTPGTGTVSPSDSQKYYITFTPASAGVKSGNIIFFHDADSSPDSVGVSGTGITPLFFTDPATLSFVDVLVGLDKTDSVTVTNTGSATLNIDSVRSDNGEFAVVPDTGMLSQSDSQKYYVTFSPASAGVKYGNVIFFHDADSSPDTVNVSGTGITPLFSVNPGTVSFFDVMVSLDKSDSITVTNPGSATLTIDSAISDNVEFTITPHDGSIITPADSQSFHLTFTPSSEGAKSGIIIFHHDAASSPDTVTVIGNGVLRRIAMQVNDKWNIISNPLHVEIDSVSVLCPTTITAAYSYHPDSGYQERYRLGNRYGCWVKFDGNQEVVIDGVPISRDTIDIVEGWNLIGSLSATVPVSSIISIPGGITTSNFFRYTGSYATVSEIEPGKGHWVKANQGGKLVLDTNTATFSSNSIRIQDMRELPPPPPDDEAGISGIPGLPENYQLGQNYPNPFNPVTAIKYQLPRESRVSLVIYNLLGQKVATLVDEIVEGGYQSVEWGGFGFTSGIYFYRMDAVSTESPASTFTQIKKMVLLK